MVLRRSHANEKVHLNFVFGCFIALVRRSHSAPLYDSPEAMQMMKPAQFHINCGTLFFAQRYSSPWKKLRIMRIIWLLCTQHNCANILVYRVDSDWLGKFLIQFASVSVINWARLAFRLSRRCSVARCVLAESSCLCVCGSIMYLYTTSWIYPYTWSFMCELHTYPYYT